MFQNLKENNILEKNQLLVACLQELLRWLTSFKKVGKVNSATVAL